MSNRVSRAISLFAALNEMSFDELKSQFENISKILAGSVDDISAGISVVKTGGRVAGTKEGTGNAGEAGDGLDANTVANVANAVAIKNVSENTKELTKNTIKQTIEGEKLKKMMVEQAMATGNYNIVIQDLDAKTTKLVLNEKGRNERLQSVVGKTMADKRILIQQYAEEDAA